MPDTLPINIGWPIIVFSCLMALTFYLAIARFGDWALRLFDSFWVVAKRYLCNNRKSLVHFGILISPAAVYLAVNGLLIALPMLQSASGWSGKNGLKVIQLIVISISAGAATYTFRQNLEYRFFENLKQRYEKLRDLLNKDVLDEKSLDEAVVTIRSLAEIKRTASLVLFKDLAKAEKNATQRFVRAKLAKASFFYFTGFNTLTTKDLFLDASKNRKRRDYEAGEEDEKVPLSGEGTGSEFIDIGGKLSEFYDGRILHDRLYEAMKANDAATNDIAQQFVQRRDCTEDWAFKSGLTLQHIFVILGFVYNINPNRLDQRMRGSKVNRLKGIRRTYPRMSACLYYLWYLHYQGQGFYLEFDIDPSEKVQNELF